MPPFSPFPQNLPPTPPSIQPPEGMDSQTKNVILFAVIFSVLSAGVLAYVFLKPEPKTKTAVSAETESSSPVATTSPEEKKKSFFDFLNFSNLFSPQEIPKVFNTPRDTQPKTTSKTSSSNTSTTKPAETAPTTPTNVPTKELIGIYQEPSSAEDQIELQFYALDLPSSPLRGKIWISSVKRSTDVDREYIILSTNKELPSLTKITGMTLKSVVTGQIVQIGKAVYLPFANDINTPVDILIEPGQKILVNTGKSPLGYSFRINLCTGYFEQYQNFTPSLPTSCPLLKNVSRPAPPNHLQDPCISYVERFGRCTIITELPKSVTDPLNDEQEYRCLNFIQNNTGYQNCVDTHKYDENFYNNEWRTHLNRSAPLWKSKREIIWLLDQNGDFISQYSY